LLISQRDMSGPRLEALSNNRWSGVFNYELYKPRKMKLYVQWSTVFSYSQEVESGVTWPDNNLNWTINFWSICEWIHSCYLILLVKWDIS
jgi:hypothetical protein